MVKILIILLILFFKNFVIFLYQKCLKNSRVVIKIYLPKNVYKTSSTFIKSFPLMKLRLLKNSTIDVFPHRKIK